MAVTLPTFSKTIDNAFMTTWYRIQPDAIDNILSATVLWAALMGAGCGKTQVGGDTLTRSISYDYQAASQVAKGSTMPSGTKELETMARWGWRYTASHVQRNMIDDQQNQGADKIKDLVQVRLTSAKDGLQQKFESNMTNAADTAETSSAFQGLNDMTPTLTAGGAAGDAVTGTYGLISRPATFSDSGNGVYKPATGNTFWGGNYLFGTLSNIEDDLITDMKKLYNSTGNNQVFPNLIVTTQNIFEIYEEFALDISQIVKDSGSQLADLGFEVLRFKGKPLIWAPGITTNHMQMLCTDFIEIVYDPNMWFDMTDWKPDGAVGQNRIAHIMCATNMLTTQPRRHGRLQYA